MDMHRQLRRARSLTSLVTLAGVLSACTSSMKPLKPPYDQGLDRQRPDSAWVTPTRGFVATVYQPAATADSLIGRTTADSAGARLAMPLSAVSKIETKRPNVGEAIGVIAGVALVAAFLVGVYMLCVAPLGTASCSSSSSSR